MAHVLIIGAGPAGAGLAHLLAHRGIDVTLLERQSDFAREFRGEVLMPSGIEALEQMGLAEAMSDVPSQSLSSVEIYINGRLLFHQDLDGEDFERFPPTALSQPDLLEMLVTEARKSGRFSFERGASVKDLLVEEGRVVGVRARTREGDRLFRADLVVGADGRASVVRKQGGFRESHSSPPLDVVWCKLPCPDDWHAVRAYAGRGHLLVGYRTWDGQLQLGWVILKGTFGDIKSRGIEQWIEEMANHVTPDLAAHLRANSNAVKRPFLLDTASDCVENWSVPGALLIGDAAHTMSPVGGQGLNIALRDTIVAANHLVPVLSEPTLDSERLEAALRAIQAERMPEVRQIQRLQALPPRIVLSRAWWGEPVRRALGTVVRSPWVRSRLGPRMSAFPFGVTDVRLSV